MGPHLETRSRARTAALGDVSANIGRSVNTMGDPAKAKELKASDVINVNVGVMGHVDSGKTSLVAALSTHLSTAALDKHPESKRRGITLDLGFSSYLTELPERLKSGAVEYAASEGLPSPPSRLQFTLVDCPGHASLIRTIIGGA